MLDVSSNTLKKKQICNIKTSFYIPLFGYSRWRRSMRDADRQEGRQSTENCYDES